MGLVTSVLREIIFSDMIRGGVMCQSLEPSRLTPHIYYPTDLNQNSVIIACRRDDSMWANWFCEEDLTMALSWIPLMLMPCSMFIQDIRKLTEVERSLK